MISKWNYENYVKAIIPLIFAIGSLLTGWVETGGLEKAEINNVITLLIVAAIVFLAPNKDLSVAQERGPIPGDPNASQMQAGRSSTSVADQMRVQRDTPVAQAPPEQPTSPRVRKRGPLKDG